MATLYFVTHPEVVVDAAVSVPCWSLSEAGRARMRAFCGNAFLRDVAAIFSSEERKAAEAAQIAGAHLGLPVVQRQALGENDRSATGFLQKAAFEAAADEFFRCPDVSWRGWETASAAQERIVGAVQEVVAGCAGRDVLVVSHGAVGTLFKCHLKKIAITRAEDQPSQGHWYAVDAASWGLVHDWRPIAQ
jgi:broad specificity phosphatase PhoE